MQSGNGGATTSYAYDYTGDRVKTVAGGLTTLYPNQYFNTALGSASMTRYLPTASFWPPCRQIVAPPSR